MYILYIRACYLRCTGLFVGVLSDRLVALRQLVNLDHAAAPSETKISVGRTDRAQKDDGDPVDCTPPIGELSPQNRQGLEQVT